MTRSALAAYARRAASATASGVGWTWQKVRGLPVIWQIAVGLAVVLLVLTLWGRLDRAWSAVGDWMAARKIAQYEKTIGEKDQEIHDLEQQRVELQQAIDHLNEQLAAKDREAQAEAAQGKVQDAQISNSRQRYDAARAHHSSGPLDRADLDRKLDALDSPDAH